MSLLIYAIDSPCVFSSVSLESKQVLIIFIAENVRSGVAVEIGKLAKI